MDSSGKFQWFLWHFQIQRYKQTLFDSFCKNFKDTEYHKIDDDFNTAVKLFDNLEMEANGLRRIFESWKLIYIYSLFLWFINGLIGIFQFHWNKVQWLAINCLILKSSESEVLSQEWILYLRTDSNIGIGPKSDQ